MKKSMVFVAMTAALGLANTAALAEEPLEMEKCQVVKDGKSLIKEHKADCKSKNHSCAGQNVTGDLDSFILVPSGQCSKIKAGDLTGVDEHIKDKLDSQA